MAKVVKDIKPKIRHSGHEKDIARILYAKGDSLSFVSRRLNIPESTLEGYARDGKWIEDRFPEMGIDDLYDLCLHLSVKYISKVILSDDDFLQVDLLGRVHKLSVVMRSLVETAPLRKATMQDFMSSLLRTNPKHPHLHELLALAQSYHDALAPEQTSPEI